MSEEKPVTGASLAFENRVISDVEAAYLRGLRDGATGTAADLAQCRALLAALVAADAERRRLEDAHAAFGGQVGASWYRDWEQAKPVQRGKLADAEAYLAAHPAPPEGGQA